LTEQTRSEVHLYVEDAFRELRSKGRWQLKIPPSMDSVTVTRIKMALRSGFAPKKLKIKHDTVKGRDRVTVIL
jgi:hypothetical protein